MKEKKEKIVKVKDEITVDKTTGDILDFKQTTYTTGKREPDYVKVYLKDLLFVLDVKGVRVEILLGLCRLLTYQNQIILNRSIKVELANELNIKVNTLEQSVSKMVRAGVLLRKATGLYIVNPYYIARGDWSDISELRMKIKYNMQGVAVEVDWDRTDAVQSKLEI